MRVPRNAGEIADSITCWDPSISAGCALREEKRELFGFMEDHGRNVSERKRGFYSVSSPHLVCCRPLSIAEPFRAGVLFLARGGGRPEDESKLARRKIRSPWMPRGVRVAQGAWGKRDEFMEGTGRNPSDKRGFWDFSAHAW